MGSQAGILVIRLKSMGDIVFTLPAVHALRSQFPESPLIFLISKEYAPLLEGFPGVALRIELDRGNFRSLHPVKLLLETFRLVRQVRGERFDVVIDFQGYGETAFLTWASGCTKRWGTVYRTGRKWAYTSPVPRNGRVHPADECLNLLRANGLGTGPVRNDFELPNQYKEAARQFFSNHDLHTDRPTLFIQPSTSQPKKTWPLSRYLELAQYYRELGWQIVFGGGPADQLILEPARIAGYPVSAGVPLLVNAGLAKLSSLVLGGDTGLLHLSVSLGKRVVMIMRALRPGSTHPFQHKEWAICAEVDASIHSIRTETVKQRIDQAWNELRRGHQQELIRS
jgi:ADP-heptose:LPS heptosyltransferase